MLRPYTTLMAFLSLATFSKGEYLELYSELNQFMGQLEDGSAKPPVGCNWPGTY